MVTVLITGAKRGIGLALTRHYVESGARVIACARDVDKAHELARLAAHTGGQVTVASLDVTSEASVAALACQLEGRPIDILINNAGIGDYGRDGTDVLHLDYERLDLLIAVNAIGPARVCAALYPNIKAGKEKKIVALTSRMASITNNTNGIIPAYRASKVMLNQLMRCLAATARPDGVTVAVFHPGAVMTDMGGAGADVTPQESASGMARVITAMTLAESGSFFNHKGEILPW